MTLTAGLAYEVAKTASSYGTPIAFVKTKGELDVESKMFNEDKSLMEAQGELIEEFNGEVDGGPPNTYVLYCPLSTHLVVNHQAFLFLTIQLATACSNT